MSTTGSLAIVTGANAGIGRAAARGLATRGWTVVMVCRNEERAHQAREEIVRETGHDRLVIEIADLSVQDDIRALARRLEDRFDRIDVLMNNAGIFSHDREETVDGIELQFAVNHLAPFLLTSLLLGRLENGRVITTSSRAHRRARMEWDNLQGERKYNGLLAYSRSKLCNILFTRELAHRTRGSGLVAHAFHPGLVGTEILFGGWAPLRLLKPFIRTPQRGAQTAIFLATDPAGGRSSGEYWKDEKVAEPAPEALDDEAARRLWEISATLTGVSD